jgi:hypothetical protein
MFKNITQTQWIAFVIGGASFLGGATAQLTELFGANIAADIASVCGLISGIAGVFLMATTGQSAQVRSVLAMPGIDKITVNAQANTTLASIAVDPGLDKIEPVPSEAAKVTATARSS